MIWKTFAKSAAEVLLDLAGPKLDTVMQQNGGEATDGGWLQNFEWGEYFDPETFPKTFEPIEQEIEHAVDDVKKIEAETARLLACARGDGD